MGANTKILLKSGVHPEYLAETIAILFGNRYQINKFDNYSRDPNSFGVSMEPGSYHFQFTVDEAKIGRNNKGPYFCKTMFDNFTHPSLHINFFGLMERYSMLHPFHQEESGSFFNLNPSSNPIWVATGKKLIDIFGGKMYFNDEVSSSGKPDYENKVPLISKKDFCENNPAFYKKRDFLMNLLPLTINDLKDANTLSSFKYQEDSPEWTDLIHSVGAKHEKKKIDELLEEKQIKKSKLSLPDEVLTKKDKKQIL